MASEAELQSRLADCRRQEAELKAQLRAASQAAKAVVPGEPMLPTPWMRTVSVMVFLLADRRCEVAVRYLAMKGRRGSGADVHRWHTALTPGSLAGLLSPSADDKRALRQVAEAKDFIVEWKLVSWVQEQNASKGVAPTSSCIFKEAPQELISSKQRKHTCKWIRKIMKRWGGHLTRFGYGERLSQDEFRQKAWCLFCSACGSQCWATRPASRALFLARKLALVLARLLGIHVRGPKLGQNQDLVLGPPRSTFCSRVPSWRAGLEVFGCWRWCSFLHTCGNQDRPLLLVNMDETSAKLCPVSRKGWIVGDRGEVKSLLRRGGGVTLRDQRSAVTLVAFLTEVEEIQRQLPQIFVSNEHILSQSEVDELSATSARNVLFARRQSSWVNSGLMIEILEVLARSLGPVMSSHRVALCMDTYRAHLNINVVRACSRLGFFLFYIPASMTGWLQPLDVLAFKKYKEWVSEAIQRARVSAPEGKLSNLEVMRVLAQGIQAVLESQSWSAAFKLTGLRGQDGCSKQLLKQIGCEGPISVRSGLPSATDLLATYPRRSSIPVDELFSLAWRCAPPATLLVLPKRARLTVKTKPHEASLPPPM